MRTVTFSNEQVAAKVNANFVSGWYNRDPKFHNCSLKTEEHILANTPSYFGTGNFCTFFVTPEREVLHYVTGYCTPDLFLRELDFVLELSKAALDKENRLRPDAGAAIRKLHLAHQGEHDVLRDRKQKARTVGGLTGSAPKDPKASSEEAEEFLSRIHARFALRDEPAPLAEVFNSYLCTNTFTEGKKTSDCDVPDVIKGR